MLEGWPAPVWRANMQRRPSHQAWSDVFALRFLRGHFSNLQDKACYPSILDAFVLTPTWVRPAAKLCSGQVPVCGRVVMLVGVCSGGWLIDEWRGLVVKLSRRAGAYVVSVVCLLRLILRVRISFSGL